MNHLSLNYGVFRLRNVFKVYKLKQRIIYNTSILMMNANIYIQCQIK